jgi:hypothetical protein
MIVKENLEENMSCQSGLEVLSWHVAGLSEEANTSSDREPALGLIM